MPRHFGSLAAVGAAAVLIVAVGAVFLRSLPTQPGVVAASPSPDPRTAFLGTWVSTSDADGGTQTMTVDRAADDGVEIVVTDTIASVCSGASSTMTGGGTVEGDRLVIPTPDYRCDDGSEPQAVDGSSAPLNEILRNLTFIRDPEHDTLSVTGADVWRRPGAPSPTRSAQSSPEPGYSTFTSAVHGMSIDYPSGWQARPATEPWTGGELSFDSPAADVIYDPTRDGQVYLLLASQPYDSGGGDGWRSRTLVWTCPDGFGEFWGWSVDGANADQFGPCNSGSLVQTDRRGYLIRLVASDVDPALAVTYSWDWLRPLLATVDLRPEDALDGPTPSPSMAAPTREASSEAEQIIANGTLVTFAGAESGDLLTVWETCTGQFDADCGHAWHLGTGSQTVATGMVGHGDVHTDANVATEGFVLTPACCDHDFGFLIAQDGVAAPLSMDCLDAGWRTPTQPRRLSWAAGLNFVDSVAGGICPISLLGGPGLARGVFTADGTLWALVDNETGPDTLTIGRYDGQQWDYHDFATAGGAWTSVLAVAGSNVVVLLANPEPSPRADQLMGLAVTTDAGTTWSELADANVLAHDVPFSAITSSNPEDWFSGYTSMAFAGTSALYVADRNGDLWRSTDLASFSRVQVDGFVSDLKPAGDAVIGRLDENDLIRVLADGTVAAIPAR